MVMPTFSRQKYLITTAIIYFPELTENADFVQ